MRVACMQVLVDQKSRTSSSKYKWKVVPQFAVNIFSKYVVTLHTSLDLMSMSATINRTDHILHSQKLFWLLPVFL